MSGCTRTVGCAAAPSARPRALELDVLGRHQPLDLKVSKSLPHVLLAQPQSFAHVLLVHIPVHRGQQVAAQHAQAGVVVLRAGGWMQVSGGGVWVSGSAGVKR